MTYRSANASHIELTVNWISLSRDAAVIAALVATALANSLAHVGGSPSTCPASRTRIIWLVVVLISACTLMAAVQMAISMRGKKAVASVARVYWVAYVMA